MEDILSNCYEKVDVPFDPMKLIGCTALGSLLLINKQGRSQR